mgnify:CR=1 FL=1
MACDQHGRESVTIIQNESIENQQQSSILEDEDEEDPFAEFAWVTGHDVDGFSSGQNDDASSEENKDDDDSHDNTLKLISTVSDSSSQKPHRGAPKMQKQKRKAHLYTELVYSAKTKGDLAKRKSNLDFVLKKTSNNSRLTYFKCTTHKNCNYTELVRKDDAGTGYYAHVFTRVNSSHSRELAEVSKTSGISERWIRVVDTLIESGRRPMQIRTHLLLLANKSADKLLALQSLPTQKQVSSRKRVLVKKKRGRWNLKVNADLINFYRSSFVQTKDQFDAIKVR